MYRLYHPIVFFFFSSRRRHTRFSRDWSSDVCSSDLRRTSRPVHDAQDHGQLPPPAPFPENLRASLLARRSPASSAIASCSLITSPLTHRSEERRVGKECGSGCAREQRIRYTETH